jgi:hypothetical protein
MRPTTTVMGRPARPVRACIAWLVIAAFPLSGCYHPRVAAVQQPIGIDPTSQEESETLWSIAWGLAQDSADTSASCDGAALQSVTAHSNLAFDLLTVITIGFFSPVTVTWRCAKPETPVVDGDNGDNGDDPL